MSRIPPVPTSRIPGLLAQQRLTQQYQADQLDLFRLQEQISTGLRINLPSEDAPAALRAISFQRLLDRKDQLGDNIDSGLLFLGSTDATLGGADGVAGVLSQIKADTLGVVGTVATDEQRQAAIAEINGALESLVTLANRQFNGRYLFSGSQSNVQPYIFEDGTVSYQGDEREIQNYSDIGVLFSSSISGQEVFGGISEAVVGSVDLNPQTTADTLLSTLRGGRGINPNGSLLIGDSTTNESSIVDLSAATTLGDIARLIEDNPPPGSTVNVTITGDGIQVNIPGGNLVIQEVGTGTTARELGLLNDQTPGDLQTITGEDLDPQFLRTTRLDNLLGTKATARLESVGEGNDILIESKLNGTAFNGVGFEVFNGGDIGSTANVVFNAGTNTLEIYVDDSGETTAANIVDAINADAALDFTASIDVGDASSPGDAGTGEVPIGTTFSGATTAGGGGSNLDLASGIRVVNGGETFDFEFSSDTTVEDLLNRLNRSEAGLEASINDAGDGLVIRSRLSGGDFQIGELGGSTATQLGIRTLDRDSQLNGFNYGVGVPTADGFDIPVADGVDFSITDSNGVAFDVDLSGIDFTDLSATDAITQIVNEINTASTAALADVTATAVSTGNVTVVELSDAGGGLEQLTITGGDGSLAAQYLGLVPDGSSPVQVSTGTTITGEDSEYTDFTITSNDGQTFAVDVSAAQTVGDVIDAINAATGGAVDAQLAAEGNGIELIDNTGIGALTVTARPGSQAAEYLGIVGADETTVTSTTGTLTGTDRNSVENDSVFNTLIRLRDALDANDLPAIERAAAKLDDDIERVTFAQADVGNRFQNLELSKFNLQEEQIQIRSALSEEIDVDLVQAISDLTARQTSLEASLRATANILQLSLLNFI
ncbi:MAG: flagellin hook IN motif-containing protein [Planctomycetota bacterium]